MSDPLVRTSEEPLPSQATAGVVTRRRRSNRTRAIAALVVIGVALAWIAFSGLRSNLVYFKTPTELLHEGSAAYGDRVRLGGLVEAGSVERSGSTVRFLVTDGTTRMTVVDTGGVPALFRAGAGVVLEGSYERDGAFHADTVLVKHSDSYTTPLPGQTPTAFAPG
jgi:cytochrome c-type biogenesis protein CcmE